MGGGWNIIEAVLLLPKEVYQAAAICGMIAEAITAPTAGQRWTEVLTMRLIDADKLDWWYKGRNIRRVIDDAPTVDAVVVTRCKDCVHWDDDPDTYGADYGPKGKCMKSFETMCADDFCSYGERKDGGDG